MRNRANFVFFSTRRIWLSVLECRTKYWLSHYVLGISVTERNLGRDKNNSMQSIPKKSSRMNLKKLLASSCRQKIIKELSKSGQINVMLLVQKINSTYNEVNRNLEILEEEGIITNSYIRHMRLIRLNHDDNRTVVLLEVLRTLNPQMTP